MSRVCRRACSAAARSSASASAALASRNAVSVVVELGVGPVAPLEGLGEADAAVELAGGSAEGVPGVGGGGEVVEDPLALDVVLEPAAEPRPGAGERLVGDLDDAVVAGDQAGPDEPVDELVLVGVGDDLAAGDAGADGLALLSGGDQPQEQVVQRLALSGLEVAVQLLGGLGDGAADPAGGLVAGDGEGASFAAQPGLAQGVGEQGEGAGLVLDLADEEVDQAGLDDEPGLPGGSFDGFAQLVGGHGGEDVQAAFDQAGEGGVGGDVSHPVGPEHQDQWRGLGVVGEQLDEPVSLLVVVAQGEELFGLVDDEEPRLPGGFGWWEGADGVPAGGDDVAVPAVAAEGGDEAGAHQGGLAGPGRAEDGEDALGLEAFEAGADVAVAAEERFGVVDVVGHQAEVGAGVAGPLPDLFGVEGGVLAKDGLLELPPVRGRGRRRARRRGGGGSRRWWPALLLGGRHGTGRARGAPTGAPAAVPLGRGLGPGRVLRGGGRRRRTPRATIPGRRGGAR